MSKREKDEKQCLSRDLISCQLRVAPGPRTFDGRLLCRLSYSDVIENVNYIKIVSFNEHQGTEHLEER